MNCCRLIAFAALICVSTLRAEASDIQPHTAARPATDAVIHTDGSVVDRLATPNSAKSSAHPSVVSREILADSPEAWLARMLDPTRNGLVVKHPELFAEWLDAVTEPRFMTALASVALTPETYAKTLGKMVDPAAVRNWAEFADPQIYMRWMAAGFDPRFYQAVFNRMTDGDKLRRWGPYSSGMHNTTYEKAVKPMNSPTLSDKRTAVSPAAQDWMLLPASASKSNPNPWLTNGMNYRY